VQQDLHDGAVFLPLQIVEVTPDAEYQCKEEPGSEAVVIECRGGDCRAWELVPGGGSVPAFLLPQLAQPDQAQQDYKDGQKDFAKHGVIRTVAEPAS
jgi:hypothetical protein